nr:MAG TPA: hypothetical protein [Caudoviricetes sp.]
MKRRNNNCLNYQKTNHKSPKIPREIISFMGKQ